MKILVFCGEKQTGKDSMANYVVGHEMLRMGRIKFFELNKDGKLLVNTTYKDGSTMKEGIGVFELNPYTNPNAIDYLANFVWPQVKIYHFADNLKESIMNIFGLQPELLWGSDEDKNAKTHITWKDMFSFLPPRVVSKLKKEGYADKDMTVREVLQYFGTEICRKLDGNCWVNSMLTDVVKEAPNMVIVSDCRFKNEADELKKLGAVFIKLIDSSRQKEVEHDSEDLDQIPNEYFTLTLDKKDFENINDKAKSVVDHLYNASILERLN